MASAAGKNKARERTHTGGSLLRPLHTKRQRQLMAMFPSILGVMQCQCWVCTNPLLLPMDDTGDITLDQRYADADVWCEWAFTLNGDNPKFEVLLKSHADFSLICISVHFIHNVPKFKGFSLGVTFWIDREVPVPVNKQGRTPASRARCFAQGGREGHPSSLLTTMWLLRAALSATAEQPNKGTNHHRGRAA